MVKEILRYRQTHTHTHTKTNTDPAILYISSMANSVQKYLIFKNIFYLFISDLNLRILKIVITQKSKIPIAERPSQRPKELST